MTPRDLCGYIDAMAAERLGVPTINQRIASFTDFCEELGHPDPPTASRSVRRKLREVRQSAPKPFRKLPISHTDWLRMLGWCDDSLIGKRDRAVLTLLWVAELRRAAVSNLLVSHLKWKDRVRLVGVHIPGGLPREIKTGHQQVAGLALIEWFQASRTGDTGPVFRQLRKGPLDSARKVASTALAPDWINRIVQDKAKLIGLSPKFISSDSLVKGKRLYDSRH